MKEILGHNLQPLFDNTLLSGKKTYSGKLYEVWEVSDEVFEAICNLNEEEFEKLCPDGMWRSADGSILGYPYDFLTVNGKRLKCWNEKSNRRKRYESLLVYLCENVGASTPENVCAVAVDLAKYNHMSMGELFEKYEG